MRAWIQVNPVGADENGFGIDADLNDVALPTDGTIVAVGNGGVIIRSTDFGTTWTRSASGTAWDLFGVAFQDATSGVAVGDMGVILATVDGGITWEDITPGAMWSARDTGNAARADGMNHVEVLPGPDYCLRKVAFSWNQPDRAVAVGDVNGGRALLLVTESAGYRWSDLSDWSVTGLRDVRFSDVAALAVGGYLYDVWAPYNTVFSADDGATWQQAADSPSGILYGASFTDRSTAIAIGLHEQYDETTDGGNNWVPRGPIIGDCANTTFADVDFGSHLVGLIVGEYGTVLRSADAAASWRPMPRRTRVYLNAVSMRDSQRAAIVGHGFTVLTTTDGGQTWGGRATLTFEDLRGVSFADQQNGMVVGNRGDVFRTTDAGATWQALVIPRTQWPLDDVAMLDPLTAVAVGPNMWPQGWILRTTDGGATWTRILAPEATPETGHLYSVSFADAQSGMALGPSRILATADSGLTWNDLGIPPGGGLRAIRCVSRRDAFAVGAAGRILRTNDAGATWVTLASGVGSLLLGLDFIDATTGWVVGADLSQWGDENNATASVILRTTDGGATWVRQSIAGNPDLPLRGVSFIDGQTGTAVGGKGWENYTGDEDPIVLRTTDGGITWSRQTLGSRVKNLYRVAQLDAQTAVAIGRRGTIVRTTTGGN